MKTPEFITFTGIDDRTNLDEAQKLSDQYPIEWGVLFSANNKDARYPCKQAIAEIVELDAPRSAHLCGRIAREAQNGVVDEIVPMSRFNRVQVNGFNISRGRLYPLAKEFGVKIVLQSRSRTFESEQFLQLFDLSGGKGEMPKQIPPTLDGNSIVGYAGGMGPDTVCEYLSKIQGNGRFWIDMESRVRTDGWFDLNKVRAVCERVYG